MKKMVTNFIKKCRQLPNEAECATEEKVKLSLVNSAFLPIGLVVYFYRHLFRIAGVFALLLTVLTLAIGCGYGCGSIDADIYPFACNTSPAMKAVSILLQMLILAVYFRVWYRIGLSGENVPLKKMLFINTGDWKTFLALLAIFIINVLPLVSLLMLIQRVPNSDWRVETLYFAVVSSGFWLPFLALRFYSIVAFAVSGQKIPSLRQIYCRSTGNTLKMLLAFALLLFLAFILMQIAAAVVDALLTSGLISAALLAEYVLNFAFLLMMTVWFNFCLVQQNILFGAAIEEE